MPSAAERRPSSAAVGCASARSIFAIMARETPERSASALADRPWAVRAARTASASDVVRSVTIVDRSDTIGTC